MLSFSVYFLCMLNIFFGESLFSAFARVFIGSFVLMNSKSLVIGRSEFLLGYLICKYFLSVDCLHFLAVVH